ncbi:amidohydrolase family protein [Sphingomonas dokdonensis]|uniref:Imidazolonepropionase n=1 Tax=Sphingomonas dokdonensis TaxID=344880 RepID=A0A245ZL58_9SPHN|nr:amidohydrolase family protein [Sphingomonas dokdonensis]OWK30482.1 imidazolonepropionase [Sphingomonas dokdonensis]
MKRALLLLATMLASPVAAQTVAITNATVALGDGSAPIEGGTVVFQNGRITAAGRGVAVPAGAEVIDGSGKWVAPGFVAGFSDLGITDAAGVAESNDAGARTSPFNAAIDVSVSINPAEVKVANERRGGVTRALVAPEASGSIFAGEGAVIDLGNDPQPVTRARAFQFVELGEGGGRLAGGSRPAAYAMLRDALSQAQDYRRNPASFGGREKDSLVKRGDAEALLRVLDGAVPLVVHVERASDILTVLALPRDYPKLKLVLTGVSEGWMVAREIAAARVPVIAAALADLPAQFESLGATESNVGRMRAAGVQVGLASTGANGGEHNLRQYAGNLVGITRVPGHTGLNWGEALASITSGPAAALGMDGEIGSLRTGRRADVVLWDGDPLELSSAPVAVWIDGRAQPMQSRQSQLRDRYLVPTEGALPKAYER